MWSVDELRHIQSFKSGPYVEQADRANLLTRSLDRCHNRRKMYFIDYTE